MGYWPECHTINAKRPNPWPDKPDTHNHTVARATRGEDNAQGTRRGREASVLASFFLFLPTR
eukprot:13836855-Alexandrium_andersonii.AAC.1